MNLAQDFQHRRGVVVLLRIPATREEVDIEWPRGKRANAPDGFDDLIGSQIGRAQRSKTARIRNRCDQLGRGRSTTHGALNDGMLNAKKFQELVSGHSLYFAPYPERNYRPLMNTDQHG